MPGDDNQDVFDLFADGSYKPSDAPMPWYPGAKLDIDDYARHLARAKCEFPYGVAAPLQLAGLLESLTSASASAPRFWRSSIRLESVCAVVSLTITRRSGP